MGGAAHIKKEPGTHCTALQYTGVSTQKPSHCALVTFWVPLVPPKFGGRLHILKRVQYIVYYTVTHWFFHSNNLSLGSCHFVGPTGTPERAPARSKEPCNTLQHTATHCNTLQHTRLTVPVHPTFTRVYTYTLEKNLLHSKAPSTRPKDPCTHSKQKCILKSAPYNPKEPCLHLKEPCIRSQEPCLHSKEPCIHSKEPCLNSKEPCLRPKETCIHSK